VFCKGFGYAERTQEIQVPQREFVGSRVKTGVAEEELEIFFKDAIFEEDV